MVLRNFARMMQPAFQMRAISPKGRFQFRYPEVRAKSAIPCA